MPKIADIIQKIEEYAPLSLQESWDNSGIQIGDKNNIATSAMLCLDITEKIIDEAIAKSTNLVISHHPLLFRGLKSITGKSEIERIVIKAIEHDITIYSAHTSMDSAEGGVSHELAARIGLKELSVLAPQQGKFIKIIVFVPNENVEEVKAAIFNAGGGNIGNYECCCYTIAGEGHFKAIAGANPYVGEIDEAHTEAETRIEILAPASHKSRIVKAIIQSHPYEEPAYDIIPLLNDNLAVGLGVVGNIEAITAKEFLKRAKQTLNIPVIKVIGDTNQKISRIAICGGSGAEFIGNAITSGAQMYISGDIKYHEFTSNANNIIIADIGHYESEQFTKDIFYNIIQKNFHNFVTYYPEKEKNPINYL